LSRKAQDGSRAFAKLRLVNFAQLLFPDFSLILCGYLLCRYTALNRKVWEPIESLVYYFLFPVLLFHSIVRTPLEWQSATHMMGAGLSLGLVGIALAYSATYWPGLRHTDRRLHAASAQVGFRFNSFIVLALVDRVAGPQGLPLVAVLIGVCVPLFNVAAVYPMVRHGSHGLWRELVRNPLIVATVSGLIASLLGLGIPDWLAPTTQRIGQASLALGLMARRRHATGPHGPGQAAGGGHAVHQTPAVAGGRAGRGLALGAAARASHGVADVFGRAHRVQLLRAGGAHGL